MSSSFSAIRDDEDEYWDFCKKAKIRYHDSDVYSLRGELSKKYFKEHKLTGVFLSKFVEAELALKQQITKTKEDQAKILGAFLAYTRA